MGIYNSFKDNYDSECDITVKRNIQDIVRSYRFFWDPFNELIQNSVDAINRRYRLLYDPNFYLYNDVRQDHQVLPEENYMGKILIEVWPSERKIKISDNGTGIQEARICKLLCPDSSDKRKGYEYGYKGKGLTFASFITNKFSLISKYFLEENTYRFDVNGLFNWMIDDTNLTPFPTKPMEDPQIDTSESLGEYNTSISLTLDDDYSGKFRTPSLDSVFSMFSTPKSIDCFTILLRCKTAIGNTSSLFNKNPIVPIDVKLIVYDTDESELYNTDIPYSFYHPKDSEIYGCSSYEFSNYVNGLADGNPSKFNCLYFSTDSPIEIGTRCPIKTNVHVMMITSTNLNRLNEFLGFGDYEYDNPISHAGMHSGIFLSIDGMSTGIQIDDWSQRGGDLKKYYVIADCDLSISDELDAGRKGISEGRGKQISDAVYELIYTTTATNPAGVKIGKSFHTYSKDILIGNTHIVEEDDDFISKINDAKKKVEEDKKESAEIYDYLTKNTSLLHTPMNEEEVRTLFHELLSRNIIKGYKTLYDAANRADYDAAFNYELTLQGAILEKGDKIGIPKLVAFNIFRGEYEKNPSAKITLKDCVLNMGLSNKEAICVEFKYSASDLLYEIKQRPASVKDASRIDLLIVWTIDNDKISKYPNCGISAVQPAKKYLHALTHKLEISMPEISTSIYVISLVDILKELSN